MARVSNVAVDLQGGVRRREPRLVEGRRRVQREDWDLAYGKASGSGS